MTPKTCPKCKASFEVKDAKDESQKYSRVIGIYDVNEDMTTHWQCPDCNYQWPRTKENE